MPVQVVTEQNEKKETISEKEYKKWIRIYERNMCPADLYDDIIYSKKDLVAPI